MRGYRSSNQSDGKFSVDPPVSGVRRSHRLYYQRDCCHGRVCSVWKKVLSADSLPELEAKLAQLEK